MRKLASIQKITNLSPIPGADNIEVASVLGWKVVVKKGEFHVGELVVYCEIDSVLPDWPEFEFMKQRGMRVRTIRLKGQISQGICFSLLSTLNCNPTFAQFEKHELFNGKKDDELEGIDVTAIMQITKYDPPIPAQLKGIAKGNFPSFIPKTDETRVQSLVKDLDYYKKRRFIATEKLDGTSVTYYIKDGIFGVCSRNLELKEDVKNVYWKVARENDIENKLRAIGFIYCQDVAIQGEIIGENIQGNKYNIKGQKVYFHNIFSINHYHHVMPDFFFENLNIDFVPIIDIHLNLSVADDDQEIIDALVKCSTIKSRINKEIWAEGIVFRFINSIGDFPGRKISFKVINPEFLLKYGE